MPLLELKTNLKSLQYGRDRINGGSSNQPYIRTIIPQDNVDVANIIKPTDTAKFGLSADKAYQIPANVAGQQDIDFVLRGGLKSLDTTKNDVYRLTKMFDDKKSLNGRFFTTKQNLLSLTYVGLTPIISNGVYTPASTLSQAALEAFGGHVNKQVNPLGITDITVEDLNPSPYNARIRDFRKPIRQQLAFLKPNVVKTNPAILPTTGPFTLLSDAPNYSGINAGNIEKRVNLGDPGNRRNKNLYSYSSGGILSGPNGTPAPVDKLNVIQVYGSETPNLGPETNDLVLFRIGVIDNNKPSFKNYIHFRANLGSITDNYSADWNEIKYLGRAEKFYTYGGFGREMSLSWTIGAQSREELLPIYQKLNYLVSTLAPTYTPKGYMTGNLVQLTIGGYLYEQVGIIKGLTVELQEDSPWEIAIDDKGQTNNKLAQLPHIVRVTGFSFVPIHNFLPSIGQPFIATKNNNGDPLTTSILPAAQSAQEINQFAQATANL